MRIKEAESRVKVTVLTYGAKLASAVLMKSLAVGADELFLIQDPADRNDGYVTATVLSAALRLMGFDMILAGRQAADTNSGGVGLALSVLLGVPAVSWARKIEIEEDHVKIERVIPDGYEILRGPLPALITVSHEAGELRTPKFADIRKARRKPVRSLRIPDLEIETKPSPALECLQLRFPDRKRHCRFVEGETPAEGGINLARTLIDDGLLSL